mmetsp:Transcript_23672/g.56058  ORF Transcript_23672/g.56058 Transcript_23672/m.56058 type:complete len:151 (+) Transcript_23672:693-1145(+)
MIQDENIHLHALVVVSHPGYISQRTGFASDLLNHVLRSIFTTEGHQAGLHAAVPSSYELAEIRVEEGKATSIGLLGFFHAVQGEAILETFTDPIHGTVGIAGGDKGTEQQARQRKREFHFRFRVTTKLVNCAKGGCESRDSPIANSMGVN